MDDFQGILARDFGLRPQGKSAPMSSSSSSSSSSRPSATTASRTAWDPPVIRDPPVDRDPFDEVFGRPASKAPPYSFEPKPPVYDDDLFSGVAGVKPSSGQFEDVFTPPAGVAIHASPQADEDDDLLASLSGAPSRSRERSPPVEQRHVPDSVLDDLLPGFGVSVPAWKREHSDSDHLHSFGTTDKSPANASNDPFADFDKVSGSVHPSPAASVDHLENIKFTSQGKKSSTHVSALDDMNVFDDLKNSNAFDTNDVEADRKYASSAEDSNRGSSPSEGSNRGRSPAEGSEHGRSRTEGHNHGRKSNAFDDIVGNFSGKKVSDEPEKKEFAEVFQGHPFLNASMGSAVPKTSMEQHVSHTESKINHYDVREEQHQELDDIWLTVSEVPLLTQPTRAPPPSRPPPPLDPRLASFASVGRVSSNNSNSKRNIGNYSFRQHSENWTHPGHPNGMTRRFGMPSGDGAEENTNRSRIGVDDHAGIFHNDELSEVNSAAATSAAAMKEAMDRAEAKFKYAREQRERGKENKSSRYRESGRFQQTDNFVPDFEGVGVKETHLNFDFEREQREKEANEGKRRMEREQNKAAAEKAWREGQERAAAEKAMREGQERAAAEKAIREAQERAATEKAIREAQERAAIDARKRAQRAAVEKANAEARERAARAAALKAESEARERAERALREAREREREVRERETREREARERETREKEAREREAREREARGEKAIRARERAAVERAAEDARRRAARAAVEKANAEARERAAATAAAAAAAAAKDKQSRNDHDLDSFFGTGTRASSQPKERTTNSDPFDSQVQNQGGTSGAKFSSTGPSSGIRKASSSTNIMDDLSSVFGAPSSGEFQEIDGETEERRKARLERHQRTLERAAKALAEKNERDLQLQREQAEKHRIAETLDVEIRRWAAGKEGNLRALLSALQYVLWAECGWQPVSLADLITAAAVKKVYRKATLCIHPDKVQQKGANLQQKYIAEKVFDLLKEAWNKFNSEELF